MRWSGLLVALVSTRPMRPLVLDESAKPNL